MNPDDTLREALRGDAGNGGSPDQAWSDVRARAKTIQRNRRVVRGGVAAVAGVALVGAVLFASGTLEDDEHTIATNPPAGQIVAVQGPNDSGDHLVVLAASDGHVVRTLADDVGITFGGISATPDGRTVYFTRGRAALPCTRTEIAAVPSMGGPVEVIARGTSPVVSPDGRTLAYVRAPADDPCGRTTELVRRDLATGFETTEVMSESCDGCGVLSPLSWSPDSTRLLVAGCCVDEWWNSVIVRPVDAPGDTRFLALTAPADGATYLPDGRILVALEESDANGQQLHRLMTFEGWPGAPQHDPPTSDDFQIQPLETVLTTHQPGVLRIAANRDGDVLLHFGGSTLERWHGANDEPVTLAHDIRDAAWLPAARTEPAPPQPTTTTTAANPPVLGPDRMAVATYGGSLDVLAADGTVVSHLGSSGLSIRSMSVAPDGKTVYYEADSIDPCATAGEIDAARLDIYPPEFSGGYMGSQPALSPDGTKLAYRESGCGGALVVVDLDTDDRMVATRTNSRAWLLADPDDGGPVPELVGPVAWDADNRHLMLQVNREPSTEFWYVDTTSDAGSIRGKVFRTNEEDPDEQGPLAFAPIGSTGKWAAVFGDQRRNGAYRIVEYDLATRSVVRTIVGLPESPTPTAWQIAGSDESGQHLLLLQGFGDARTLYRWSEGDASPTLVARDISTADW